MGNTKQFSLKSGSYLISGDIEENKTLLLNLLKEGFPLIEASGDLFIYQPSGASALHTIDSIRNLSTQVYIKPYNLPLKIFILLYAERMQPPAFNALLKTLEEPSPTSAIFLVTSSPEKIAPTILSRCQKMVLAPIKKESSLRKLKEWEELVACFLNGEHGFHRHLNPFLEKHFSPPKKRGRKSKETSENNEEELLALQKIEEERLQEALLESALEQFSKVFQGSSKDLQENLFFLRKKFTEGVIYRTPLKDLWEAFFLHMLVVKNG